MFNLSNFITESLEADYVSDINFSNSIPQPFLSLCSPAVVPLLPNIFTVKTKIKVAVETTVSKQASLINIKCCMGKCIWRLLFKNRKQ